jgi:hypothetical protein
LPILALVSLHRYCLGHICSSGFVQGVFEGLSSNGFE